MSAYLETNFRRGFLLSEENIIKLTDIIMKRLAPLENDARVHFKVYSIDGMLLELDTPSSVAAQENSSRNAVKRVDFVSSGASFKLLLQFDTKDSVELKIESSDRDLAYLLYSDIKDYLHADVLKFRSFSFDAALSSRNAIPFYFMPMLLAPLAMVKDGPTPATVSKAIEARDAQTKLNFLIEHRPNNYDLEKFSNWGAPFLALFFLLIFIGQILDKAFPRNIFYWGRAAQKYDLLLRKREKVVWGVLVSFLIGIAATLFVEQFGKHPKTSKAENTPLPCAARFST